MPDVLHVKSLPPHAASTGTMLMLERSSENIPTSYILLVLDALSINITPTFQVDLSPLQSCSSPSPTTSPTSIVSGRSYTSSSQLSSPPLFRSMLAPEHPSPWQSSQVYAPSPGTAGFPFFFPEKRTLRNTRKVPCHVRPDRAAQNKRLSIRTSCLEGGIFLCLERFTVEAETLQTHAQRHTPRSNPIVGAMPLSCGFSSVQEHSLLWISQANA